MEGKKKFIGFKCSLDLYKKIHEQAEKESRTAGGMIRKITKEYIKRIDARRRNKK